MNEYRKELFARLTIFAALSAIFLIVVSVCFLPMKNRSPATETNTSEILQSGCVLTEKTESGISLVSSAIPATQYESRGVTAQAESACSITATLSPNNDAENTGIAWTARFENAANAWATRKSVKDYIGVIPAGEDYKASKTATVECYAPFGEPIIVTATSVDNPAVFAECHVDYVQKVERFTLSFGNFECNFGGTTYITLNVANGGENPDGGYAKPQLESSEVYTIGQDFTVSYACDSDYIILSSVKPNDYNYYIGEFGAFADGVMYGGNGQFQFNSTLSNYNIAGYGIGGTLSWLEYAGFKLFSFDGVTSPQSKRATAWSAETYVSRFNTYGGRNLFDLTVTITGDKAELLGNEPYVLETTVAIGSVFNTAKISSASLSKTELYL